MRLNYSHELENNHQFYEDSKLKGKISIRNISPGGWFINLYTFLSRRQLNSVDLSQDRLQLPGLVNNRFLVKQSRNNSDTFQVRQRSLHHGSGIPKTNPSDGHDREPRSQADSSQSVKTDGEVTGLGGGEENATGADVVSAVGESGGNLGRGLAGDADDLGGT